MPTGRKGTRRPNQFGVMDERDVAPGAIPRYIVIARCSDRRQVYNAAPLVKTRGEISLPAQIELCVEFGSKHGWQHVGTYWDIATGVSAERTAYREAIRRGHEGRFDVIVCWKQDRVFRGMSGAAPLVALLHERSEIQVRVVEGSMRRNLIGLYAIMTAFERDNLIDRIKFGHRTRARSGMLTANFNPYWLAKKDDGRPILDPDRAPWMIRLIHDYVAGINTADIQKYMRHEAPSANGSGKPSQWTRAAINSNLSHSALYGDLQYGRYRFNECRDQRSGAVFMQRSTKTAEEQIDDPIVTIPVPPLIHKDALERLACPGCERDSLPTYADIQGAKARRRTFETRPLKYDWPLRGKVFCWKCGTQMQLGQLRYYYRKAADGGTERHERKTPRLRLRCSASRRCDQITPAPRCRKADLIWGDALWERVKRDLASVIDQVEYVRERARCFVAETAVPHEYGRLVDLTSRVSAVDQEMVDLWWKRKDLDCDVWEHLNASLRTEKALLVQERDNVLHHRETGSVHHTQALVVLGVLETWGLAASGRSTTEGEWGHLAQTLVERVEIMENNEPQTIFVLGIGCELSAVMRFRSLNDR
jgi:DNA invertase Pin-like site-specific DNA recombinase